jgi:RHS repeat-associated protein
MTRRTDGEYGNGAVRYTGISVTLYGKGEAVAVSRSVSTGSRGGSVYLGKDILGSVRSSSNEYGVLEDRYEYDAFGKPYKGEFGDGMNLGYTGKPYDEVTGLYNYGYRDYKPGAARFTTVDPIRDGNNWFAYVNNDPVNFVDLWGLEIRFKQGKSATLTDVAEARRLGNSIANSGTRIAELYNELDNDPKRVIVVEVNRNGINYATPGNNSKLNPLEAIASVTVGGNVYVQFDPNDTHKLTDDIPNDPESTLVHEVIGHAYLMAYGNNYITPKKREVNAAAVENEYRYSKGLIQVPTYGNWNVPQFAPNTGGAQCTK